MISESTYSRSEPQPDSKEMAEEHEGDTPDMRKSRYTITAEWKPGQHPTYNAANGMFAVLDEASFHALSNPGCADPKTIEKLAEQGLLTELSPDEELSIQKERFAAESNDLNRLTLSIAPTYACNCRCPYCYEQDKDTQASMMGEEVQRAILAFARERYAAHPYTRLSVQWYGGDPSLALDVVERLSGELIAWCQEADADYDAMMLSNCARIDAEAAALLARCQVSSVLVTIDGPRDIHNIRRPTVEGDDAFGHVMDAISALQEAGIRIDGMINLDKVTMPLYPELKRELAERGINLAPAKLNDYAHSFGIGKFAPPYFDLFTHDEFHRAQCDAFLAEPHSDAEFRDLMSPACRFCEGQRKNYFVIDCRGDAYRCDGWMGDRSRALGNLLQRKNSKDGRTSEAVEPAHAGGIEPASESFPEDAPITFDPFVHDDCRECEILPLCWGNCSWERERCNWPCHPLKSTIEDYLRGWAEAAS